MYILGIETTGHIGSVSLLDTASGDSALKSTDEPMAHLRNLVPMIAELLSEQRVAKDEIDLVAVSIGPGSYTGIRIGVSTARALCQGLGIPCISVSSLDQFRILSGYYGSCTDGKRGESGECGDSDITADHDSLAVIFNARRGQVYGAIYAMEDYIERSDGGRRRRDPGHLSERGYSGDILPAGAYMLDDMIDKIREKDLSPLLYGDGVDAYMDRIVEERLSFAEEGKRYQTADMTARYALEILKNAGINDELELSEIRREDMSDLLISDYNKIMPEYMRKTEAEQRLLDGSLEKARIAKMNKFLGR